VNSQTLEPTAPCALCGEALTSYHAFGEQVWHHKEGFYAPHKDTDCFLAQTAIKRGLKAMKWNTVMSALTAAQARIVELSAEVERLKVAINGKTDTIAVLLYKLADICGEFRLPAADVEDFRRPTSISQWRDPVTMDTVFKIEPAQH